MLGLGANITGGSPVGASGVAAPSLYFYDADMATDDFTFLSATKQDLPDYEGISDVIKITAGTYSNHCYIAANDCGTLVSGRKYKFEIDYYIPSSSSTELIEVYVGLGGVYSDITASITNDQWVTATSSDISISNGNITTLLIKFDCSPNDVIYISDIRVTDVTVVPTSPTPPPGGFYNLALDQQVGISGVQDLAAVYSVNLLVSFYDGDAIRVRRASDNTEQDIGFVNGELDTSALAAFCAGTDGFVKTWYDQSGVGNDATQTTTSRQPKIYDAATGVELENAVAAMTLNGSSHTLVSSSSASLTASNTIVLIAKGLASSTDEVFNINGTSGVNVRIQSGEYRLLYTDADQNDIAAATDNQFLFFGGRSQSQGVVFGSVNGGNQYSDSTALFNTATGTLAVGSRAGTGLYWAGAIQAAIFYTADKSADRAAIETALNDYFNVY